jgi:hypothetical protein
MQIYLNFFFVAFFVFFPFLPPPTQITKRPEIMFWMYRGLVFCTSMYLPLAGARHSLAEIILITLCLLMIVPTRAHNSAIGRTLLMALLHRWVPAGFWKVLLTIGSWLLRLFRHLHEKSYIKQHKDSAIKKTKV